MHAMGWELHLVSLRAAEALMLLSCAPPLGFLLSVLIKGNASIYLDRSGPLLEIADMVLLVLPAFRSYRRGGWRQSFL